jgi:hypothetical protein
LREDAIKFAIEIFGLCDDIKSCSVYVNQKYPLFIFDWRNIHEAEYARSKADFINKLKIAF